MTIRFTEDHLQSLEAPIAVIGNGRLGYPFGEAIDQYPTVIRFNAFQIEGYETQCGTRVTHWCTFGVFRRGIRTPF